VKASLKELYICMRY